MYPRISKHWSKSGRIIYLRQPWPGCSRSMIQSKTSVRMLRKDLSINYPCMIKLRKLQLRIHNLCIIRLTMRKTVFLWLIWRKIIIRILLRRISRLIWVILVRGKTVSHLCQMLNWELFKHMMWIAPIHLFKTRKQTDLFLEVKTLKKITTSTNWTTTILC